jgi:glycosyltransferase involved in cell wall biosynthesis
MERLSPDGRYFHIDRVLREPFYQAVWKRDGSEENRIFSLCGNAPFKGAVTVVRALIEINQKGKNHLKLRLAGVDHDSSVGVQVQKLIQHHGLEEQVDLLGRINPQEIIREMRAARVFVLPSHMDNSPNSLAEAMIVGMPCVASDAGGIPSMIQDGKDGLLYPNTEISQLAERIQAIINDPELAAKLARQARQTALIRHDPARIAQATMDMYREVLLLEGRL